MAKNTADNLDTGRTRSEITRRKLSARVEVLIAERNGLLPVWLRAPLKGPEHYTGFTRAKLYELAAKGKIRSVSIREPGQIRGTRLFELASILRFIEEQASASETSNALTNEIRTEEEPTYKENTAA